MKKITFILPVLPVIFLFCSCTASYDVSSTKNPEFNGRINKMLVVVIKHLDSAGGIDLEEKISNSLNSGSKRADPFRKIFPYPKKKTMGEILGIMQELNYDGLLIVSPYDGDYNVNPDIPEIRTDSTVKKGDIIKGYFQSKLKSGISISAGYFCCEIALFNVSDEMLVLRSSLITEAKMFEFLSARESNLSQAILEELQKKKIVK